MGEHRHLVRHGYLAVGYLPTVYFRTPKVSLVIAAMAVIPYASWIAKPFKAALVAAGLGLCAGAAMIGEFNGTNIVTADFTTTYLLVFGGFCGCVGRCSDTWVAAPAGGAGPVEQNP